jgi:hypothetical protein
VFRLEDFFLSLPDEMAGAEVLVFASRDFLMGAFCRRFDDRGDVRIISDRVVEKADLRGGCLLVCLASSRRRLNGSNRIQRGNQIGLVSMINAPTAILTNMSSCGEEFLPLP